MLRWITALLLGVIGTALGAFYGWVIDPVEFIDTTPASLRADYRADYVLMVAEAFNAHQDADGARRQLSFLGANSPGAICTEALSTARATSYSQHDLELLEDLNHAMLTISSVPPPAGGAP
jgi:hypothetical protein